MPPKKRKVGPSTPATATRSKKQMTLRSGGSIYLEHSERRVTRGANATKRPTPKKTRAARSQKPLQSVTEVPIPPPQSFPSPPSISDNGRAPQQVQRERNFSSVATTGTAAAPVSAETKSPSSSHDRISRLVWLFLILLVLTNVVMAWLLVNMEEDNQMWLWEPIREPVTENRTMELCLSMLSTSPTVVSETVSTAKIIAVLASLYIFYSMCCNVPDWIKDLIRKRRRAKQKDANDDLANPVAIIGKLKELQTLVSSKNEEMHVDLPWYKLYACFLSMFHLSAEIRKKYPKHRDEQYESCGPFVGRKEAEYLRTMLDYADWAYLASYNELLANLQSRGYELLRHDTATEPGRVGHFVALNHDERICLIGLKGTSTFSDILTDVVGTILPHELDAPFSGDEVNITCHEGIFTAASMVADDLEKFLVLMVIPQAYRIVICGHSLGAGTACLLGLLLRSRIPQLRSEGDKNRHNLPLEVVAFATPAVLNYTACVACAPFTTSVVNNSDMVPRLSVSNLLTINQGLLAVNRRLEERGLSPNSFRKAYRYAKDLVKLDEDTLMTVEELDEFFREVHAKDSLLDEHDLYVPGRVVALFERGEGREVREKAGLEAAVGGVVADGSMKRLRQLELTTSMIWDHFCTSYANNLDDLLRDM